MDTEKSVNVLGFVAATPANWHLYGTL